MTQPAAGGTLQVLGVSKAFGGTQALDNVSFEISTGEVVALLGENGAGKSTLIKTLAGVFRADQGRFCFKNSASDIGTSDIPVDFIHQDLGLIDWMTVGENICLTLGYPSRFGLISKLAMNRRAREALDYLELSIDPEQRVFELSRAEQSLVAISRAISSRAKFIVLDEPTASLPAPDVIHLFQAIRRLKAQDVGVLFVSHRIDEIFEISDRAVVLRDGKVAGERITSQTTPEEIVHLIVGTVPPKTIKTKVASDAPIRLELRDFTTAFTHPVRCAVRRGEIVGFVGLRGAGQADVSKALFGRIKSTQGDVLLDGNPVSITSPGDAISQGLRLICADRVSESIAPDMSVAENFFLNPNAGRSVAHTWTSWIKPSSETITSRELGRRVNLYPNSPDAPIESLSGGNQQKVVIGRWLQVPGNVYLLEDPTAGVDVGSKSEIYVLIRQLQDSGAAVIVISTDFEEIEAICNRVLVFGRGCVVAELAGSQITFENLLHAAAGGADSPKQRAFSQTKAAAQN